MIQNTNTLNWQKIYLDYSPKLLGICRRYIPDIYTAEDIVQDSFITAIQKNGQLNNEKALFAWLKKIVVNNALQHLRKHSKDTFVTTESSEIPDTYSEMDHSLSEEKNIFIYDFTREELLSSIDSLPSHHRSVFNLYFMENHSHAEISGLLGITVNTSKSHLLRAKKSVQQYLLNNVLQKDTPKKKLAQLFVIFGLGGLLWAQTFQNAFVDFKISPSKKLDVPSDIISKVSILPSSNGSLKKKAIVTGTVLVIITISVVLSRPGNVFSTMPVVSDENPDKIKDGPTHKEEAVSGMERLQNSQGLSAKEATFQASVHNNKLETETPEVKLKEKQHLNKFISKDSLTEVPQKVVVVKKIIKRDTIFVEK
ncbi:sigma-70 family RNA polymerase sigma factor [uncultured Chryseobacterium sp.]|uniref:RNA polymerase sigma factor n=1 Tax=uncultured Chryseobacterium sp. TaxID=259322 RepID=UPI0025F51928|nr:sigma-70 family RNA polymerase sigma factor [uncultured Chryseobacterium sp.]